MSELSALDLARESIVLLDLEDRILAWNAASEAMYGWSRAEALGELIGLLVHCDQSQRPAMVAGIRDRGAWEGELTRRARGGRPLTVDVRRTLIVRDAVSYVVECGRELAPPVDYEVRYRILFNGVPTPLFQLDLSGVRTLIDEAHAAGITDLLRWVETEPTYPERFAKAVHVVEVNDAAVALCGAKRSEEVLGPIDWLWKTSPETLRRSVIARLRGESTYSEETRIDRRDGGVVDVLYRIGFPGPRAELPINVSIMVDLSDARLREQKKIAKMEAELSHAARVSLLGELTASIAHEVNQPIAAIRNGASAGLRWLDRAEPDIGAARRSIERVVECTTRAAEIVYRVRAMATKQTLEQETASINDIIQDAAHFLRPETLKRGIRIVLDLDPARPSARVDRVQIQQVIVNLALNAVQAMTDAGDEVLIETRTDGTRIVVAVEDSGPGIAPENMGRLFESFFTTKGAGMGLGLRICRSIILAHEGEIEAMNRPQGGARFAFTLPALPCS